MFLSDVRWRSARNIGFNQERQILERFLPSELASFRRNHRRNAALRDVNFYADRDEFDRHAGGHFAGEIRVIKACCVGDGFVRFQFHIAATEKHFGVGGEIGEGGTPFAAHFDIHLINMRHETMGRQPARESIRLSEGTPNFLRGAGEDAVELDGIAHKER
jgi:hypothetical protein